MYRKSLEYLNDWYNRKNRKPLLIRGARQTGKTTLVKLFSTKMGLDLIYVNLEKEKIFSLEKSFDVPMFLRDLEVAAKKTITENSLLFLDEIQASPKCISMLRYLYEERPNLPVIAAGSLLEFILSDVKFSVPVGRIEYFYLGPMTFSEYLLASGEDILVKELKSFPCSGTAFEKLERRYREYLFVGGMPEAINEFVNSSDLEAVRRIHKDIMNTYKDDINKYANGLKVFKTSKVLDRICGFIGQKIKYSQLLPDYPARDVRGGLDLLNQAKVISMCFHTNASGLPLRSQIDESVFKVYFLDVGLYNSEMGLSWRSIADLNGEELLNKGVICEQFVAQHLAYRSMGKDAPSLYYWLKDKKSDKAEVDFVLETDLGILPLEVKSGASGHLKSLSLFMAEKKIKKALRLDMKYRGENCESNVSVPLVLGANKIVSEYKLKNLPVFQVECL